MRAGVDKTGCNPVGHGQRDPDGDKRVGRRPQPVGKRLAVAEDMYVERLDMAPGLWPG